MHLLGREMKVWATLPDGTEKPLVWIKDWDFNWQATYQLKEPLFLPKGSKVHLLAYYDNSDKNPRNPNRSHPRDVTWGEQTTDEMCIAFLTYTKDAEHLTLNADKPGSKQSCKRQWIWLLDIRRWIASPEPFRKVPGFFCLKPRNTHNGAGIRTSKPETPSRTNSKLALVNPQI